MPALRRQARLDARGTRRGEAPRGARVYDSPMGEPWRPDRVDAAYRALLRQVGAAHSAIGDIALTSHWPLVGTAEPHVLIVGQAVYGWIPTWRAASLEQPSALEAILRETQSVCYERTDPMDWIVENRVRASPFWRTVRLIIEALIPATASPWYSHIAWTNLYPIARNDVKGNPEGVLRSVQEAPAADLLDEVVDAVDPIAVLVLSGPFWYSFAERLRLARPLSVERPILAAGWRDRRPWVVGMHPAGAQRRGWRAQVYAAAALSALRDLRANSP